MDAQVEPEPAPIQAPKLVEIPKPDMKSALKAKMAKM